MAGLVLWQSKYGSARQYAAWLAEETGAMCREAGRVTRADLLAAEFVVLCGAVRMGRIGGEKALMRAMPKLHGKRVVILAVGLSDPAEAAPKLAARCKGKLAGVPCHCAVGGYDMGKMRGFDRMVFRMLRSAAAQKPAEQRSGMEQFLFEQGECYNGADRRYLTPVLRDLQE